MSTTKPPVHPWDCLHRLHFWRQRGRHTAHFASGVRRRNAVPWYGTALAVYAFVNVPTDLPAQMS